MKHGNDLNHSYRRGSLGDRDRGRHHLPQKESGLSHADTATLMQSVTVTNATKGLMIGESIDLADTCSSRLFGLLGRKRIGPGRGLLIEPSSGVHTFGMAFPIDVVALDKQRRVIRTWPHLTPFRLTGLSFNIDACLEIADGQIDMCMIEAGDRLEIVPNPINRCSIDHRSNSAGDQESLDAGHRSIEAKTRTVMGDSMIVIATVPSALLVPRRSARTIYLHLARGIGFVAASGALLALARWSPEEFLALLGGAATAGLAIMISGWN
jgi:uncharacterized protein